VVEDLRTETRFNGPPLLFEHGVVSGMSMIIAGKERPFGVLGAHTTRRRSFTKDDVHFLQSIANVLAQAIERKQAEEALKESQRSYQRLVEQIPGVIYQDALDENASTLFIGPQIQELTGYTPEEWQTDPNLWLKLVHPDDRTRVLAENKDHLATGEPFRSDYRLVARDGRIVWVRDEAVSICDALGQPLYDQGVFTDITERKRAEESLRRLNRELVAISNCNEVLVHAEDEQMLLNEICRIICEEAGYRMAWVGYAENDDAKTVRPVAWAGYEDGYLATANITWADTERGRGPTGTSIRNGETVRVQDWTTSPLIAPWREDGLSRGYRSNIALPLKDERAYTFGTLSIYSTEPNAFTSDEIHLLEQLSADLAFGITTLRARAEHRRNEQINASRLHLMQFASTHSLDELLEEMLNETEKLTNSMIGFCHFVEDDQKTLTLQNWSTRTKAEFCQAEGKGSHYGIDEAGVWVDCVYQRRAVIHNDYASLPHRKGMPKGHAQVIRELVVPVIRGEAIKAILGVGNKPTDYNEQDIGAVSMLADLAWEIAERKRAEENLRRRTREAETLRDATTALTTSLDLNHVLDNLFNALSQVIPYDSAVVFLHEQDRLHAIAGRGFEKPENVIGQSMSADNALYQEIVKSHQTLIIPDVQTDPRYTRWGESDHVHGWLGVPLIAHDHVIGQLTVDNHASGIYNETHAELALAFANQAATALENARLFDETRRRLAELDAVNRISTALRTAQTLDEMLPCLLDETLAMLNAGDGIIYLHDATHNELRIAVARGALTYIPNTPRPADEGLGGMVITARQPFITREFTSDPRTLASARQQIPPGWGGVGVPIFAAQEIVGVLFVAVPLPREITTDEAHLLTTLAEIAGNAMHRSRLHEQTGRRLEHVQALHAIDMAISGSIDLRITLDVLLEHVTRQLRLDAAAVLLLKPGAGTLEYAAGHGFRGSGIRRLRLRLGEDYAGQAALEQRMVSVPNLKEAERPFTKASIAGEEFVAYYGMPLVAKGQVKGVLEVFHRAPLDPDEEWLDFLETLAGQTAVAIDNAQLFTDLQRSNLELGLAYDATIEGWSHALDLRDRETEGHSERVTEMTERLARAMGMSETALVHVRRGALLHDIGKMGVPDDILLKPDKLTDEEWAQMRQHPQFAYDMLVPIAYLRPALDIPYCHHEKWDGTGYPRGLKGEEIPLAARIFAVVDMWDALTSNRPYRAVWSKEKALEHIKEQSGKHFDTNVVSRFLQILSENIK